MKKVRLEVIAPTVQQPGMCSPCELILSEAGVSQNPAERAIDEYPQDWQDDYERLTHWVYDFADRYGDRVLIKVIDPQSPEGLLKSVRYWIRKYPTWVVNGRKRVVGWDREALEAALQHP